MASDRVLLVDDDPVSRRVLRRAVEHAGWHADEAACGQEALEHLVAAPPDLLLLDVMLPDVDGFEICRRARAQPALRGLPIILVTALGDRNSRVIGLEAGADDFITKPIDPVELTARVRSLLRLRHYQSLSAQRALLEAALEGLSDGLVIAEADGTVVCANRPACRLLGLPSDAPGRKCLFDSLALFDLAPPLAALLSRRNGGRVVLRRAGEPALLLEGRLSRLYDTEGLASYLTLAVRDVTEDRAAAQMRSDFLSLTAHKIRTPLTILRGLVDLLIDDESGEHGAALVREMAPDLGDKLNDMADIVSNLTLLDRLNDSAAWPAETASVAATLRHSRDRLAGRATGTPLAVTFIGDDLVTAVPPVDLGLVFTELLTNAAKFARNGSAAVSVTARRAGQEIVVEFADDGIGVPHESIDRVFDECFQVAPNTTGSHLGLGLGLTVVRRILEAHGGGIEITATAPGHGTTFRLHLPAA